MHSYYFITVLFDKRWRSVTKVQVQDAKFSNITNLTKGRQSAELKFDFGWTKPKAFERIFGSNPILGAFNQLG
ncbi:conserved hypothetical protein, partial [Trichinella spiralis]|uniref:hypothetical protein n=1 Tax=Trichinella spiralis TaxID=6334 RepID=UPI0001EFEAA3